MDFSEGITEKEKITVEPIPEEEPPPPRIVYYVKKRNMTLVKTNSILPKPLTTHFQRYCGELTFDVSLLIMNFCSTICHL